MLQKHVWATPSCGNTAWHPAKRHVSGELKSEHSREVVPWQIPVFVARVEVINCILRHSSITVYFVAIVDSLQM